MEDWDYFEIFFIIFSATLLAVAIMWSLTVVIGLVFIKITLAMLIIVSTLVCLSIMVRHRKK